jgi:hypothetical protein
MCVDWSTASNKHKRQIQTKCPLAPHCIHMFMMFRLFGDDQFCGAVDVHVELKNTNYI